MYTQNFSDSKSNWKVKFVSAIVRLAKRNKLSKKIQFSSNLIPRGYDPYGSNHYRFDFGRSLAGSFPEQRLEIKHTIIIDSKRTRSGDKTCVISLKCYWFYRHIRFHISQKTNALWNLTNHTWSGLLARNLLATVSPLGNLNRRLDTGAVHSEPGSAGRWSISDNLWAWKGRNWG